MPRLGVFWTVSLLLVMFLAVAIALACCSPGSSLLWCSPCNWRHWRTPCIAEFSTTACSHASTAYSQVLILLRFVTQHDTASRRVLVWTTPDELGPRTFTMLATPSMLRLPVRGCRPLVSANGNAWPRRNSAT